MSKHTLFSERTRHSSAPTPRRRFLSPMNRVCGAAAIPRRHAVPPTFDKTTREVIAASGKGEDS